MACSISGAFCASGTFKDWYQLKRIIENAEDRGRDSFGISLLSSEHQETRKWVGKPSDTFSVYPSSLEPPNFGVTCILNNNRAEPTTEFVLKKTDEDIQPFTDGNFWISHNGTIANDKELAEKYGYKRKTKIHKTR